MKKNKNPWFYLLALLGMFQFAGCNQTDDGSFVEPITVYEKINGNYRLVSMKMVDEIAKAQGAVLNEVDLSSKLNFPTFAVQFNVDTNNLPTSYSVTGEAPELFTGTGFWQLSHPFPMTDGSNLMIQMFEDAAKTKSTGYLYLTTMKGAGNSIEFKLTRTFEGRPYVSYLYKLLPVTE